MAAQVKLWNKNLILVILINFLIFVNHLMILSTFPFYIETLGGDERIAGIAATLFSVVAVVLRPVIGWLLNNGLRKKLLFIGLAAMGLMSIGYIVVSVFFLAFVFRMVHGAGLAFGNTANATMATDIIPKQRFAEGMGMFGMATALSTAVSPALGLALMEKMGYPALFISSAASIGAAIILCFLVQVPDLATEPRPFNIKELINREALPASVITMVFLFSYGAFENFTAKFAAVYRLPSGGIFFFITAAVVLFTRMTLGKVTDRRGEAVFVYTCNASMMVAQILLGLYPSAATFILAAVFVGYGFGGFEPALQSMAVVIAPPEKRGSANSTFFCAYDIGLGIGGGIAGSLIKGVGYQTMFLIMMSFNVLSVILYLAIGRNHPSAFRMRTGQ